MNTFKLANNGTEYQIGKILCLGRNYVEHAREMKAPVPFTPVIFLKPSTAVISDDQDIVIPPISSEPHHEVELIVAIGKNGKNIPPHSAHQYILGYGIGLDMTLRDIQSEAKKNGLPWSVAKGFDTSAPISEIIQSEMIPDPQNLTIRCSVNGTVRQESSTREMIFSIRQTIEYMSSLFTLETGDLIFTGTPEGVSKVKNGDIIEAELVGYTKISHRVRFA